MGKLILLPSPLGDHTDYANDALRKFFEEHPSLNHLLVESPKIARSKLLNFLDSDRIQQIEMLQLSEHTKEAEINDYLSLANERDLGIFPDAGMPGVADPGRELIRQAHRRNIDIFPAFGTSSVTTAVACSGLNGQNFTFHGYLPVIKENRIDQLKQLEQASKESGYTQVFIETPYRNVHLWKDLINYLDPECELSISVDLFTREYIIKTASIADWKKMKWPKLSNRQAVFLINRS